jgi:hypothetical protein
LLRALYFVTLAHATVVFFVEAANCYHENFVCWWGWERLEAYHM